VGVGDFEAPMLCGCECVDISSATTTFKMESHHPCCLLYHLDLAFLLKSALDDQAWVIAQLSPNYSKKYS